MAIDLTPVAKRVKREHTPLDQIPKDVVQAVEEALEYCATHPDEKLTAELGTQEAAETFLHHVKSYARHRKAGQLVVEGNPTKSGRVGFTVAAKPEA